MIRKLVLLPTGTKNELSSFHCCLFGQGLRCAWNLPLSILSWADYFKRSIYFIEQYPDERFRHTKFKSLNVCTFLSSLVFFLHQQVILLFQQKAYWLVTQHKKKSVYFLALYTARHSKPWEQNLCYTPQALETPAQRHGRS